MIDLDNLQKDLNSLCQYLDGVYEVNYGGCCFLASEIAKYLDKLGISYSLVIYDDCWCAKDSNLVSEEVRNCKRVDYYNSVIGDNCCYHYCLCITGDRLINSDDYDPENFSGCYVIDGISYKNIAWIYKKSEWNCRYDRSFNKNIRSAIKLLFKKYVIS